MDFVTSKKGQRFNIPGLWDRDRDRLSYDNGKTGFSCIPLLAGDREKEYSGSIPVVLREYMQNKGFNLCGTCSGDCPGCYAKKSTRNIAPAIKYILNTLELKEDPERFVSLIEREMFGQAFPDRVYRLHDSGDFDSYTYYECVMDMSYRHPESILYSYTKESSFVYRYGITRIPETFTLSCSPWKDISLPIGDLPQFIYDDHTDPDIAKLPHCPAVSKDGKRTGITCKRCGHCALAKHGDRWAVYAH